jgi:hypothetical protein
MRMFIEVEVDVEYEYQPKEDQTPTYPGCEAAIENISVFLGEFDVTDLVGEENISMIENQCWIDELEKQQ